MSGSLASAGAPEIAPSRRLRSRLEAFREKHSTPAVGGAVVTRDGRVELDVVGVRVRGGTDPVQQGDRWHIGSCGKSITALLYGRLVERGVAAWGARIPELFPDLVGTTDRGWAEITVDDLFISQAGLPANLDRAAMLAAYEDARPLRDQRTQVAVTALARAPRRPGRFLYSNLGYIVIGAAIERITDRPFEEALTADVLEPLGLSTGGFGPPGEVWGHEGRMVALGPLGLVDLGRRGPVDPSSPVSDNPAVMSPAGRLHLSLADWARVHQVFLGGREDFLRPDTVRRILTPAPGSRQRHALGWAPAPGLDNVSLGQQGSNTFWVATALMDATCERVAMVVFNEGRARLLNHSPKLAVELLLAQ